MKYEIEIPDLPDGWRAVAYRIGVNGETIIDCGEIVTLDADTKFPCLIVEKIKPRRIVLEETSEFRKVKNGEYYFSPLYQSVRLNVDPSQSCMKYKIWRVVEDE